MVKRLQQFMVAICIFGLIGGCAGKGKKADVMVSPEVKEEEGVKPGEVKPGEQPVTPSESEIREGEAGGEAKEYPGIEGKFLESSQLKDVYFAFDKADLSPDTRRILSENVANLKQFPNAKIQVEGHCDERGSTDYNLALGERRAANVKNYLMSLGIPAESLSTISYGEEMPVDPGHSEEAWAKNRRAHMIILLDQK